MRCAKNAHTASSNTKPTAYKTQPPMGQSRTVVGKENVVHHMQTMCVYNAPKPEQKNIQVRDVVITAKHLNSTPKTTQNN